MRVLEARFQPELDSPFLIVGHLVWLGAPDRQPAFVQPAPSPLDSASQRTFLSKIDYLVSSTAPDCFERLQQLRSRFWSFVEVTPSMLQKGA